MLGRIRRYVYSRAAVLDVRRGHAAKLQACLDAGADANWRTQHGPGFHLLDIAVLHGHLEIVNTLLSAGANPNAKNDDGSTPLHTAARVARPAILDALLEAGGNPNDRDEDDVTVLHRAIMFRVDDTSRGQRITAEDKVVLGADPTAESQDLVGVVRILINAGADPNAEMRNVGTAVHLVAKRDTLIPASERDSGVTEALVDIMKKGGADIDRKTVYLSEMAPIHAAVRTGPDMIRILLRAGANPDTEALHGVTALHHAFLVHKAEPGVCLGSIKALLEGGANPNSRTWTGVQTSAYRERAFQAARELDEASETFGDRTRILDRLSSAWSDAVGGLTPLHLAARFNLADVIRVLRLGGADPDLVDENGMTPLELAERWDCTAAADALRESLDEEPE